MRQRIKTLLFSLFFVGCGVITFTILDESGGFLSRFETVTNDEGSGRLDVYKSYIKEFAIMDSNQLIVGHGFNSGVSLMGISAHNDWLETLYDFGIFGLVIYAVFNVLLLKRVFMLIKLNSPFAGPYAASYAIFVTMSMISHLIIYPNYFTVMVAFWGWVDGNSFNKVIQHHPVPSRSLSKWDCAE